MAKRKTPGLAVVVGLIILIGAVFLVFSLTGQAPTGALGGGGVVGPPGPQQVDATFTLRAFLIPSWSCLGPSDDIDVTINGVTLTTQEPDWGGTGGSRTLADPSFVDPIGTVMVVTLDYLTIPLDKTEGFLLMADAQELDMGVIGVC